jgi:anti-sigma factor RsiW
MITRENYEEYFLLYGDKELSQAARSAVEKFVAENPDLQEEWETLLQCRVDIDSREVFPDKELLLRADLLSYIDGELDEEGRRSVEEFVGRYPSKALELEQLQMTVSAPDLSLSFPDKERLFRYERRRLLFLPWMQAGIAAAVLGVVALLLLTGRHNEAPGMVRLSEVKKISPAIVTPSKPAPLYSTGSDDQDRKMVTGAAVAGIAKDDRRERSPRRKTETPAPAKKAAEAAVQQQEVALTATKATSPDNVNINRATDPALVSPVNADAVEKTSIKPAPAVSGFNIPKEQSSFATQELIREAQAEDTREMVAAAPAGKNKLRGLFRKVSRTFGKTADRDDDGQKEVLISAFQVALK